MKTETIKGRTRTGIEMLRGAVKCFDDCRETFNQEYSPEDLIKIYRALLATADDIYPDRWTNRQVIDALNGIVPTWNDNLAAVYPADGSDVCAECDAYFTATPEDKRAVCRACR